MDISQFPAILLGGPEVIKNKFYRSLKGEQKIVVTPHGKEVALVKPPITVDLQYSITSVSQSSVESLNIANAIISFFTRIRG